jgi:hypothetical protein
MREHGRVDSRVHLQDQGEFRPAAVMFLFFLSLHSSLLFKNISRVTYHELKVFFLFWFYKPLFANRVILSL